MSFWQAWVRVVGKGQAIHESCQGQAIQERGKEFDADSHDKLVSGIGRPR